jgi:hypothetical protein
VVEGDHVIIAGDHERGGSDPTNCSTVIASCVDTMSLNLATTTDGPVPRTVRGNHLVRLSKPR